MHKIMQIERRISSLLEYYAEMQLILCKDKKKNKKRSYSAVIHQRILYVILPQITLITLIFLLLSLALSETMSQMTGCSFAQDYAD